MAVSWSVTEHEIYKKILSSLSAKREFSTTEEFSIPDIFSEEEWAEYPRTSIQRVCKLFKVKVDLREIPKVVYCHQSDKKWAVYKVVL